jgi:hypothetical protein
MQVTLPYAGWFWARVWLEDAAGNVDEASKSAPLTLRWDDQPPGKAVVTNDDRWLNAATPDVVSLGAAVDPNDPLPMSGIRGYSVTLDGALPDATVETEAEQDFYRFPATYPITGLPEGVTVVRVRTVSNVGLAANEAEMVMFRLDRSLPTAYLQDPPDPHIWQRTPVALVLTGEDQLGLSGMTPAPAGHEPEEGAHLVYALGGQDAQKVGGSEAHIAIADDGEHTITYRAVDAAGNASTEKSASFKIDRTPPMGAFDLPNVADPRHIVVEVSDATSGVAAGHVEYRREGEGGFRRLPARLKDGRLDARLDDLTLPPGRYEFRARVVDVAGNEAVIGQRIDGARMALTLPLRGTARLDVTALHRVTSCVKARKRPAATRKRKPARCKKRISVQSGAAIDLPHGKRSSATGRLTTGKGAVANADIIVEAQSRSGGRWASIGAARTDVRGAFRFAIPAGPSRTIRYRYPGSNMLRPAVAQVTTRVSAAARLSVDRRRVRNGQAVRFSGRLLGRPIPTAGKIVALQAKVGRRWRTFATPRANAGGSFKHRYRFTATTGLRRYAFRALVTREAAYPYERGISRTVHVTVRGPARLSSRAAGVWPLRLPGPRIPRWW